MSGPINSSNFGKMLWPGIEDIYGRSYAKHDNKRDKLFTTYTSRKQFEEDVGVTTFGLFNVKGEGDATQYDSDQQGFITRYTHVEYSLGFIITSIMLDDDLYDQAAQRRAEALAFSNNITQETVAHNVYNRAFNSSYTGGDGKEMCATDHPNVTGGTWANELATAADLSEASLEQACIDLMKFTNDRGHFINVMPETLIIPVDLSFEAVRILKGTERPGTTDRDINALNYMGKFKEVVETPYLTDTDAWFIRTNAPSGMKHFMRSPDRFNHTNDYDTDNAKYKASFRASWGWTDPRGIYGSPGA